MKFNIPRRRFRCRAERSHVVESAKWVTPPPAAPREAWREERRLRRRSERRARHAERRGESNEPHQSKPHWGTQTLPHHIFPLRAPHARPAGGGTNPFSLPFIGCTRSARLPELSVPGSARVESCNILRYIPRAPDTGFFHLPPPRERRGVEFPRNSTRAPAVKLLASRPAWGLFNRFWQNNTRAVPEIKDNRFPLHKRPVSTSQFLLLSAFPQNFTIPGENRSLPPRPSPPVGAGRGEYSRRGGLQVCASKSCAEHARLGPPLRANLSVTFPFAGKGDPCAGSAKENIIAYKP